MRHRMTYHNIRNMIYQLIWSGGYFATKFNYSNLHVHEHAYDSEVEFDYSNDTDITDHVSCLMIDNNKGCGIIIKIVMFRNGSETELNVRLMGIDKNDVMTCESFEGYDVFRTRMHMIHHKATRRLLNRIYNRMTIHEMHKQVAENVRNELERRKELKND